MLMVTLLMKKERRGDGAPGILIRGRKWIRMTSSMEEIASPLPTVSPASSREIYCIPLPR